MDRFTLNHLDTFLARMTDSEDERATIKAAMLAQAADDMEYWLDKGWMSLFDAAGGFGLVQ